ncbi:MAG TPA: alpha/beta fold hydrolase [Vicinamibacterales bacterium]|nr:alpha/beta fold hydrolase [Vicinamibacterales bacterium]
MLSDNVAMQSSAEVREHDVRLPSGIRLHYIEQGPASGPAILLLHGYTDSSGSWGLVMPLLPPEMRVVALDQRGHGFSDRPEGAYTVDDFATDALEAMDALQIASATVVGHSMGSFVARRVAERAPDRVSHLVLLGSAPTADNAAVREVLQAVNALSDPVDPAFVREFQLSTAAKPVPPDFMAARIVNSQNMPAHVWKSALGSLVGYRPSAAITCPTLVIGGDADGVFSKEEQAALAREIPGAVLDLEPGIGHALNWEDPDRFVASLLRFLGAKS